MTKTRNDKATAKYIVTRCGEGFPFDSQDEAIEYGRKLCRVYGNGDPRKGTAVFLDNTEDPEGDLRQITKHTLTTQESDFGL